MRACAGASHPLLGWQPAELVGRPIDAILPQLNPTALATATCGEHVCTHVVGRDRSSHTVWVRAIVGNMDGDIATTVLIEPAVPSPQKGEMTSATRTVAKFEALMRAAVDGIVVIDAQGVVRSFNPAAERIFGYEADEVVGSNINRLMPEPHRSQHDHYIREYLRTGHSRIIGIGREVEGLRKDGVTFPMDLAVGEVRQDGERQFVGILRDISSRRQTENLLRQREEQLRLMFDNAPIAMGTCDTDGTYQAVNPAMCAMLRRSREELLQRSWVEVAHPSDQEAIGQQIDRLRRGETDAFTLGVRYVRGDGGTVHGMLHCGAIHDEERGTVLLVAQIEDLTEHLRAEDDARQHRERLAHIGRLSALGQMAAGIAHEVNQPLSAIATYAQASRRLAEKQAGRNPRLLETLEKIAAQAQRAGEVIQRLRNLVQKRESDRILVEVSALARQAVQLGEVDARMHDLTVDAVAWQQRLTAIVDPVQIQQVILNLVRNGIEATGERASTQPAVVVRVSQENEKFARVDVCDWGYGLNPEAADHLFSPFFTTKASGMGMGLSISHSIVTAHGGRMWHTPNPDGGAVFSFTLPLTPD